MAEKRALGGLTATATLPQFLAAAFRDVASDQSEVDGIPPKVEGAARPFAEVMVDTHLKHPSNDEQRAVGPALQRWLIARYGLTAHNAHEWRVIHLAAHNVGYYRIGAPGPTASLHNRVPASEVRPFRRLSLHLRSEAGLVHPVVFAN
jgi:hypothetical protein